MVLNTKAEDWNSKYKIHIKITWKTTQLKHCTVQLLYCTIFEPCRFTDRSIAVARILLINLDIDCWNNGAAGERREALHIFRVSSECCVQWASWVFVIIYGLPRISRIKYICSEHLPRGGIDIKVVHCIPIRWSIGKVACLPPESYLVSLPSSRHNICYNDISFCYMNSM